MDSWLNYHHLYYFRVIAAEGSIARAARILRLGQPTLSAQLRQLEDKLGVQLFERQHKKLILTEHGRMALEYAAEIFRMGSEMVEVLQDRIAPSRTHVQLGALDSISKQLSARMIEAAYKISPCTVSVLEDDGDQLVRELLAHRIDLILTNRPPASPEGRKLVVRSLARLPVVVCGAERFKNLRKDFPRSLDKAPFVMPTPHSKLRHDVEHFFSANRIQPDVIAEIQDTSLQMILGTQGVGLLPIAESAAASLLKRGDLIRLGSLEGVYEEIFLAAASRKIENPISSRLFRGFVL